MAVVKFDSTLHVLLFLFESENIEKIYYEAEINGTQRARIILRFSGHY